MLRLRLSSTWLAVLVFSSFTWNHEPDPCSSDIGGNYKHERYRATIDVVGKHLSGILIFKQQDDSSQRVVFLNEMGMTFFDLGFTNTHYTFYQIMNSLDKKAVKKTLAKDFGMLLGRGIFKPGCQRLSDTTFERKLKAKGKVLYTINPNNKEVQQIDNLGKHKVVSISLFGTHPMESPDSLFVQHHNVNFTIQLKKIHATE